MGTPWPAFILPVTLLAFQVGGWRVGAFAFGGLGYMLVTNIWAAAMMSVYLCTAAVLICFLVGGLLGLWAAHSDAASRILRPINDTLQTIPLFVFLIPVVMVFLHGDFAAVLAICMYAIVPAIRYTELGIRSVPPETVEVARAFGCTGRQTLFFVKLPLALPVIMLGLNQVIVFALSMLIVTSLLGTKDLGQSIYEALTRAETGKGLVAGFAIALLAMIADRIIQSWSNRKKAEYGLA
jgi:glycine betaine/proline transport system permease protein